MVEIVARTPAWVFVLLVAVMIFGLKQTRDRSVSRAAMLSLPAVMATYSLADQVISLGLSLNTLGYWLAGAASMWLLVRARLSSTCVIYDHSTKNYSVSGSWIPLLIISCIFSAKYTFGAVTELRPDVAQSVTFIITFSVINGAFFGFFFARFSVYWRASRTSRSGEIKAV